MEKKIYVVKVSRGKYLHWYFNGMNIEDGELQVMLVDDFGELDGYFYTREAAEEAQLMIRQYLFVRDILEKFDVEIVDVIYNLK